MHSGRIQQQGVLRLFIGGDVVLYREGLKEALEHRGGAHVLGTGELGPETLATVLELRPSLLLLDMSSPKALAIARAVAVGAPTVKTVALGLEECAPSVIACAEAGIVGYVARGGSLDDLMATLKGVDRGEVLRSPRAAEFLRRRLVEIAHEQEAKVLLGGVTGRELEVLKLIDQGLSNKEIAQRLGIEVATVKNHVHKILAKLHVSRRGAAAARAREQRVDGA